MNKGFATEQIAREKAVADMPNKRVCIIESQGQFYVEPEEEGGFLRNWEREAYVGLGRNAMPKHCKTCGCCGAFIPLLKAHEKEIVCRRCGNVMVA